MGLLLLCNGGFMLVAAIVSRAYKDGATLEITLAGLATLFAGILLMFTTRDHKKEIKKREGYIVVTFGWIFMSLSGTFPYIFTDAIPNFTEAPGGDKLHPRITDTAKRLWLIYVGYTAAETILLQVAGMSFFDAINHAMSTLSTGGFSTKNVSVAHWNDRPAIQYIIMVFMFLAGTNFVLSYFAFKGKVQKILHDQEFKFYFLFIAISTIVAAFVIYFNADVSASSVNHPMVNGEGESAPF